MVQYLIKRNRIWLIICLTIVILIASIILWYIFTRKEKAVEVVSTNQLSYVSINCNKNILDIGETLEVNIEGDWEYLKSSNSEIVKVEGSKIIGVDEGEAIIYAVYGENKSNKIKIKCYNKLEEIKLQEKEITIDVGDKKKIDYSIIPQDATYNILEWESSNINVATVKYNVISGVSAGEAVITVRNSENVKNSFKVNVKEKVIEVENLSLDENQVNLGLGQSYILMETISPNDATNKEITWSSSDGSIISVDNGIIKANSVGQAVVSITSNNGKKASCTFNVSNSASNNSIKYATNSFNVRIRPGTEYQLLGNVNKNDEIEVLKEDNNWSKIRIKSSGIVGYTILKAYASQKSYYIDNVPFLNQMTMGYPTGCEAVSATMAARFKGYDVSVETIINNTPTDSLGKRQETTGDGQTIWVGENPFKYFVGYPTKIQEQGSYGCFAEPICVALRKSGVPCSNISGSSIETIYSYIENNRPVIIWCRINAKDINKGVTWYYPDGSGSYEELVGEHCSVLIGYDENYVYLNDPIAGKDVTQPRGKFESNWHILYDQAVIID